MSWIALALLSTIAYSATSIVDKSILSKYIDNTTIYATYQVLFQQVFVIFAIIFTGIEFSFPLSLIAMICGTIQVLPWIYYLKAVQVEEISRISAMEGLYPIFVFIGANILFHESFAPRHWIGGALLLISVLILAIRREEHTNHSSISPALKYLLGYWVFSAVYFISLKYLINGLGEWSLYSWSSLGSLIAIMPCLGQRTLRTELRETFNRGAKANIAMLSREFLEFTGMITSFFAASIAPITMIALIGSLQPVITLIIVLALGVMIPNLIREEVGYMTLKVKLSAAVLASVGLYLVS